MNIQFRMTVEQYKDFCQNFFKNFNNNEINEQISQMSINDFKEWHQKIGEEYYEKYSPVKELAKLIRGDYNPIIDYDTDKEDPLDNIDNKAFFVKYREVHNDIYQEYFNSLLAYKQKMKDIEVFYQEQAQERLLNIEVDGKAYKAIKVISVLWSGWECDQYAWLVNDGEQTRLVASNHGSLYFTDKSFLENKLAEYKTTISETEDLLLLIK